MPKLIEDVTEIAACGNKPKIIQEIVGKVNSQTNDLSIAHMKSPVGWEEPGQTPEFDEYTYVLKGSLSVASKDGQITKVQKGQGVIAQKGEWVRYSTPDEDCEYIAVCLPAFSPDTVHRDGQI